MRSRKRDWGLLLSSLLVVTIVGYTVYFGFVDPSPRKDSLHVDGPTYIAEESEIINFTEMTSEQQDVFLSALNSSEGWTKIPLDDGLWIENAGVRYENGTYTTGVAVD